jgi:predicted heme/steroid binding protein
MYNKCPYFNSCYYYKNSNTRSAYSFPPVCKNFKTERIDELFYDSYIPSSPTIKNNTYNLGNGSPNCRKSFSTEEAIEIALSLNINFENEQFDIHDFTVGINIELEHGTICNHTNITDDDPIMTGKIALAHLNEFPDYYKRLDKLEEEADAFWSNHSRTTRRIKEFTLSELAQYDGSKGKPAYVAVNGIIYDVSNEAAWAAGTHFGLYAGKDLTQQFKSCHDTQNILKKLAAVGVLKS